MRTVLQRVSRAEVRISGRVVGAIRKGFVVLLGVGRGDTEDDAAFLVDRTVGLRVFADHQDKMNLALKAAGGELLVISQFTLFADLSGGRRPSFLDAAPPDDARRLYEHFVSLARDSGVKVETGEFGAMMQVDLVNDGPVTIMLDSKSR
ncbi:MAG: D-aminoacyl-tRNA deacylase [Candidatus Binataceae bacterium]